MPGYSMDDYVPVNERIEAFTKEYPEGSLQSEIVELTDSRVTVKGYAYRKPDDPRPGVGHSSLEIPGKTNFTRGSEIENAETSAWGRAIAALGFEVKRGIASHEEVRNKQSGAEAPKREAQTSAPADKRQMLAEIAAEKRLNHAALEEYATLVGIQPGTRATEAQLDALIAAVSGHGTQEPLELPMDDADLPTIPPQPGTDAYKELAASEKAAARAYWAERTVSA